MDRTDSRKLRVVSHNLGVCRPPPPRAICDGQRSGDREIESRSRIGTATQREIASLNNERARVQFRSRVRGIRVRGLSISRQCCRLLLLPPPPTPVAELLLQRLRKPEKRRKEMAELLAAILISLRDRQSGAPSIIPAASIEPLGYDYSIHYATMPAFFLCQ
jgi:hypothetical protein